MAATAYRERRFSLSGPLVSGLAIWGICVVALFLGDRQWAMIAFEGAPYAAILIAITAWTIPKQAERENDDVFRAEARGTYGALRYAVVIGAMFWCAALGFAFGGFHVPVASAWLHVVEPIRLGSVWLNGLTFQNFVTFAVIPGALLLALRAKPRQLGLSRSAPGTWRALALSWILPLIFIGIAFARGRLTVALLGILLLHNLFSNGFTEEFFSRGMIMSHLRALQRTDWAVLTQALIFALLHIGSTITDEHGNVLLAAANVIALNFPMGVALGFMALRSRSLLLPSAVHVSLDTMKDLVGL